MFGRGFGHGSGRGRARLFRLLGAETRQRIIEILTGGPLPVSEVARRIGVTQPAASQHLAALREAGLVTDRRDGQQVYYSLVGPAYRRYRLGATAFGWFGGEEVDLEAYRRFLQSELGRTERRLRRRGRQQDTP
jgi:DNA-binding transcriptional ArsR family regulator